MSHVSSGIHSALPSPDDEITSPRNRLVRQVARLRLRRERDATGTLSAEGPQTLAAALSAGVVATVVLFGDAASPRHSALLVRARDAGARLVKVSDAVMRRLCNRDDPEGVVSVLPVPAGELASVPAGSGALLVVVESLEKPGNLGAVVRTACAAGACGVVVCDRQADPFSPGAVRASLGTVFQVPVAVTSTGAALAWLRSRGLRIVAATPSARRSLWDADLGGRLAVAVGNERRGLSAAWLEAADVALRIPMPGPTDSLNATTAAGVLLWEAVRQRRLNAPKRLEGG